MNHYEKLIHEAEELLNFLERYPHRYPVDISGHLDAVAAAISASRDARQRWTAGDFFGYPCPLDGHTVVYQFVGRASGGELDSRRICDNARVKFDSFNGWRSL